MSKLSHNTIKYIVTIMLAAIPLCVSAILFCLYTNSGFTYLVKAASFYYDKEITITNAYGTISRGITIQKADIMASNLHASLTNVRIQYSLQHIFAMPQLAAKKMLLHYGMLNTTITDINVTKDADISFKIPSYNINSNTKLTKHNSGYDIVTSLDFAGNNLKLTGSTSKQNLTLKSDPKSAINATIKAAWHDVPNWDITAYENSQNDGLQSLSFYSNGTPSDFVFALNELAGFIADKPLNATLIYKKHSNLQSLTSNITYGDSYAKIAFNMEDDISLKANINTPDLSEITPELLGAITADIDITGTAENPKAKINLDASNIFESNASADNLTADISINENGNHDINASITASGARYKNIYKKQSVISINGNLAKHTIDISSTSDTNFASKIEGSYDDKTWSGKIIKLALSDKISDLKLAKSDKIMLRNNTLSNNSLCLAHNDQTICTKLMLDTGNFSWHANVNTAYFDLKNLSPLNFFSNLITIKSGSITGDLSLDTEQQNGYFKIKDADLYLKKQNIYPTLAYLNIESKKHTATIAGEIVSENDNKAKITGTIKTNKAFEAKMHIKGNDILINNTKNTKLIASPNITVFLHDYLDITGKIDISEAKFTILDNDEVVLPNDIIITNYHSSTKSGIMSLGTNTSLHINLLDNIAIEMQKIYSKLKGSLLLNVNSDGNILATGTINAYNGSFSGYGHKLSIERGKLVYDKAPIDSPWLNIEASRSISLDDNDIRSLESIIVGIIISGNIATPEITLFANPSKYTENEILSLLLTGSLSSILNDDGTTDNSPDNAYSMLLGKNLIQSLGVLNKLSDKLSLNEITIGSAITEDQTKTSSQSPINITMSKDINSKLKLIGTFGIYSDDYSLSALYNINKNIMLKGYVNQLSHGLNMLYRFYTD